MRSSFLFFNLVLISVICGSVICPLTALGKEKKGDYSIIYKRNIFGATVKKEVKTILKPVEISLADKLVVKGIIIREKGSCLAVIENRETKVEHLCKRGDILLGAEIVAIEENKVVVRNGKNKKINLLFAPNQRPTGIKSVVLSSFSDETKSLRMKEIFKKLKTKLSLLSRIRVKPTLVSGKVNGYQVSNIPSDPFFKALGIKNGDAVRKVNGKSITSIPKAFEVYRNLKPNSVLNIDIIRDGKPITLKYRLE